LKGSTTSPDFIQPAEEHGVTPSDKLHPFFVIHCLAASDGRECVRLDDAGLDQSHDVYLAALHLSGKALANGFAGTSGCAVIGQGRHGQPAGNRTGANDAATASLSHLLNKSRYPAKPRASTLAVLTRMSIGAGRAAIESFREMKLSDHRQTEASDTPAMGIA
jgi:hypothetical protein